MKKFTFSSKSEKLIADVVTPVSIYLKLRDRFSGSILLESSDYHGDENSFSYICCNPIATFQLNNDNVTTELPDGSQHTSRLPQRKDAISALNEFTNRFYYPPNEHRFITNGFFGFISYDAIAYFEDISLNESKTDEYNIPQMLYKTYRNVIAINHFKNEMHIFDHMIEGVHDQSNLEEIKSLVKSKNFPHYDFDTSGEEFSNLSNEEYLEMVSKGKSHCFRGDVFQIVLSRRFQTHFKGDEFNVYRALRSINPSPYLFYFDYGNYKIFGSSPEAQIVIKNKKAIIYPIAGTFRRSGNDEADAELAKKLSEDPKENAEHVMLVDLARNDLSRNGSEVTVETFKEIQYYSHVIHLVSKVCGTLGKSSDTLQVVADTFPAGTLSGAPKHKAMALIDAYEPTRRGYYGGAIGFFGFNGDFNHAIMIRSFLSKNNWLFFQAGAGIVAKSVEQSELEEVNNKLAALRNAIEAAQRIKN